MADPPRSWAYDVKSEHTPLTTTGGHVWPAAKRLAAFLEHEHRALGMDREGATVLELGAGCGWLGMTLAHNLPSLSCVCMTEQEGGDGVVWLQHNVALNEDTHNVGRVVSVAPCDWTDYCSPLHDGGTEVSTAETAAHASAACSSSMRPDLGLTGPGSVDPTGGMDPTQDVGPRPPPLPEGPPAVELRPASRLLGPIASSTGRPWDFIIGSDLIYSEQGCRALPQVGRALAKLRTKLQSIVKIPEFKRSQ